MDHEEIHRYVLKALDSFTHDPADTAFQKGYEAAFKDMLAECFGERFGEHVGEKE